MRDKGALKTKYTMTLNVKYGKAFLQPSERYPGSAALDWSSWTPYQKIVKDRLGLSLKLWKRPLEEYSSVIEEHADFLAGEVAGARLRLIAVIDEVAVAPASAEWFLVRPVHKAASPIWKTPPRHHWITDVARVASSDEALRALRESGCTGIEGVPNKANKPDSRWMIVYATQPVGRGLDHPWLDTDAWEQSDRCPRCPTCRNGVSCFSWRHMDRERAPHVISLLADLDAGGVAETLPRLLRRALPQTDFAYSWHHNTHACAVIDNLPDYAEIRPNRVLYCSRRARGVLLEGGFAKPADFVPAVVVERPEPGQALLDESGAALPLPALTPEEHTARCKAAGVTTEVLGAAAALSIDELRERLRTQCPLKGRSLSESAEEAIVAATTSGTVIPLSYAHLAHAIDRRSYRVNDDSVTFVALNKLRTFTDAERPGLTCGDEPIPPGLVAFGSIPNGDTLYFATASSHMPGDCEVLLFDHETSQFAREWPSVLAFFTELVEQTAAHAARAPRG